jgi:hypothetical protein
MNDGRLGHFNGEYNARLFSDIYRGSGQKGVGSIRQQCPEGNQPRANQAKRALRFLPVLADDRNFLRRRDVSSRLPGHFLLDTEMVAQVAFFRTKPIASAHNEPPPTNHFYRMMSVLLATLAEF